jgi:hypothetical protein
MLPPCVTTCDATTTTTTTLLRPLWLGLGLLLLSAHVTAEVAMVARGGDSHRRFFLVFWPGALLSGALACAPVRLSEVRGTGVEGLLLAAALAWWARVLDVFALAYVGCALVLFCLEVADARGLLRYDLRARGFYVTRSTAYAALRALSAATPLPRGLVRLVPLLVATAETLGMAVHGGGAGSYAFPTRADFASYALLKSAIFVALPLLEAAARS